MKHTYALVKSTISDGKHERTCYGIALVETDDSVTTVIEEYIDLSQESDSVTDFVRLCNDLELDKSHLADAVEDFLAK